MKKEISARFIISADDGKVQKVGYRLFIIQKFRGYGLIGPIPENIPHDGVRVTVRGDKETIESFYEELKEEKPEGEDIGKIKLSRLELGDFEVKNFTQEEFQFLLYGQLSTGISAILKLTSLNKEVKDNTEEMKDDIGGINKVVGGLDDKYGIISKTMFAEVGILILILLVLIFGSGFI